MFVENGSMELDVEGLIRKDYDDSVLCLQIAHNGGTFISVKTGLKIELNLKDTKELHELLGNIITYAEGENK